MVTWAVNVWIEIVCDGLLMTKAACVLGWTGILQGLWAQRPGWCSRDLESERGGF